MDPSTTLVYYFRSCVCVLTCTFLTSLSAIAQDYFQQQVDYTINVRLDDATHTLHAHEDFTYTNNSSTSLDTIWIHVWPNAYKDRISALCKQLARDGDLDLHFAKEEERGSIDSLDFSANEQKLAWGFHPKHEDIAWLLLTEPLRPTDSITVSTPFRVQIPDGKFSRLGHTGEAYYITQWYPKPAVFDAQGWHTMPYLSSGEFYSEFGSFDVTIILPENYVVGATGMLQTAEERAFMDRLAAIQDTTTTRGSNAIPASSSGLKTIRFTQDKVHDFAWFADKRFIVRKSEVALPKSGRTVTTWALFTPRNKDVWAKGVNYVDRAVLHYGEHVGEYPYDACTAVDGTISAGGGMEYPMITIINSTSDAQSLDNVITHEVGHNWFYGILGSNERDHAWMDEGMNSFVELLYMRKYYPNGQLAISIPFLKKTFGQIKDIHRFQSEMGYRLNARRNLDQPLSLSSNDFTMINYGTMVYMKTALVMDHLLAYLGEETMDRCLQAYYNAWKFKHPQPEDMRVVFEKESGKDLGWVFDGMIGSDQKVDVKALRCKGEDGLRIRSNFNSPVPFPISFWIGSDSLGSDWIQIAPGRTETLTEWPNADRIVIDANNRTLDIDRRNNKVRSHGLCKRGHFPKFEPFLGLERNDRRSIYYAPAVAWNGHDGFQAGLVLHNTTFPSQRTEWVLAPLYGFGSQRIGGAARIEHHSDRMQSPLFQNITLGLSGRMASTYHDADVTSWYRKLSPYITFQL
ncbi:MAG TPA: M1 family metallopeptidase, partial [Flavobacteriales bacterium]|nr:M1 family metallopeptidase [Flavobacteriales bacterium]